MGPVWVQWIFSVACIAVGGYFATVLITQRGEFREALGGSPAGAEYQLSHLVMALGMAAMFAPVGDPLPRLVWVVVFGMSAAWFASGALRAGLRADATGYHLVAHLAMLFMLVSPHHHHGAAGSTGGPGGSGHEGHTSAASGGWLEGPLGTVLTVVLAGYFAVYAARSLLRLIAAGPTPPSPPLAEPTVPRLTGPGLTGPGAVAVATGRRSREYPRVQAGCHGVMNVAMTVMFGLMLWP